MVPSYSLVIWLPKTPKSHQSPVAPSSRKLWFSEDTQFWPKYSNGPGVAKSWQISKVTIRCHKRCLKLSWDQIWQKNSNGKCPKLPIRSAHSLRYIGGLSVNLNHLKIRHLSMDKLNPPPPRHWDPDLLAHLPGIAPTANIPRNMVDNPGIPMYPKVPVCWVQKNKVLMLHQKIAHIPHTIIPPGFGWSRHSFTLPPTMRVLLKEIVTYSFTSEWPKWKWRFPLS